MYLTDILNDLQRFQYHAGKHLEGFGDFPSIQIYTGAERLVIKAQVPGLNRDDLRLTITDDVLAISGEIDKEGGNRGEFKPLRRERNSGKFQKTVELPYPVDADSAEAVLKNGILTITFALKEDARPRQISIQSDPATKTVA